MPMDPNPNPTASGWVVEYLLRGSYLSDSLIKDLIKVLPISDADSRLNKTLLLRTLQSQLAQVSLFETTLEILEFIEELDRRDGAAITDAMKRAYCAVAVECTVKYLESNPDPNNYGYFDAVRRIWRGRVRKMEENGSGLCSEELNRWRDEVEAALCDSGVCERLANVNSRREAIHKVKEYLKDACEVIGPPFLESLAALLKGKGLQSAGGNLVNKYDGSLESSVNAMKELCRTELVDGGFCVEEAPVIGDNEDNEELEKRVMSSDEHQGSEKRAIQKGNLLLKHEDTVLRQCHRGVTISGAEEVGPSKPCSKFDIIPSPDVKTVPEYLKSSPLEFRALFKDPLSDALHVPEVVRSESALKDINHEPPTDDQCRDVDVLDAYVCKSIILFETNDANLRKKSSVHCSNVHRPNLMERNSTACTYEWDDSIDNMPEGRHSKRRKIKWTSLEEETLRAGVQMFGEGNWAAIRRFYSNIFQRRSGVDLKDKWRNMIR